MKNNNIGSGRKVVGIATLLAFTFCIAWIRPGKGKPNTTNKNVEPPAGKAMTFASEEGQLVYQLESDGLISQVKGFVVEKKQNTLFIDGTQLPASKAQKYLSTLKKTEMRVQVYPFVERLKQHPDAGFMQVLMPVMFSSPCVDTKPKKEGC